MLSCGRFGQSRVENQINESKTKKNSCDTYGNFLYLPNDKRSQAEIMSACLYPVFPPGGASTFINVASTHIQVKNMTHAVVGHTMYRKPTVISLNTSVLRSKVTWTHHQHLRTCTTSTIMTSDPTTFCPHSQSNAPSQHLWTRKLTWSIQSSTDAFILSGFVLCYTFCQ